MHMLIGPGVCEVAHLLQEQWILEDALNGLDQIRFQGAAMLLLGIPGCEELLQGVIALVCLNGGQRWRWVKIEMPIETFAK